MAYCNAILDHLFQADFAVSGSISAGEGCTDTCASLKPF